MLKAITCFHTFSEDSIADVLSNLLILVVIEFGGYPFPFCEKNRYAQLSIIFQTTQSDDTENFIYALMGESTKSFFVSYKNWFSDITRDSEQLAFSVNFKLKLFHSSVKDTIPFYAV